jgi:hypothetical protein
MDSCLFNILSCIFWERRWPDIPFQEFTLPLLGLTQRIKSSTCSLNDEEVRLSEMHNYNLVYILFSSVDMNFIYEIWGFYGDKDSSHSLVGCDASSDEWNKMEICFFDMNSYLKFNLYD